MNDVRKDVLNRLSEMDISYEFMEHAPAHTMEDCKIVEDTFGAVMPKNLFLTPRNQSAFYLCIVRPNVQFRTADISKQIGSSRLSFGSAEKLKEMLRTLPGAISPMGLMFDPDKKVTLLMDSGLRDLPKLAFHPCDNTASLCMSGRDFFGAFLPSLNREPIWVEIDSGVET